MQWYAEVGCLISFGERTAPVMQRRRPRGGRRRQGSKSQWQGDRRTPQAPRRPASSDPRRPVPIPNPSSPISRTEHPPRAFVNASEEEFARILDFYRVRWRYEPRSFPLQWDGERVTEMFTPDFYLPALDTYIELTTMRQSLVTKKNRKLRRL